MNDIGVLIQTVDRPCNPSEEFIRRYHILVFQNERDNYWSPSQKEPRVRMVMTEQSLHELVRSDHLAYKIMEADALEAEVRNRCPAVKKAWEQYRMLLEISK